MPYPAESLIDYVPHDCDGDKCKFAGCRFTIKLSFVLEKAALVLEGGWRHSAGSSCLAPFPPRGGPCPALTPSMLARSHALLGLRAAPHDVGWDSPWQKARRRTSRNGTCGTPWAHFGRGSASARPRVYVAGAYIFLHVDLMPYASQERRVSLCTRWGWGGGKDGREGERGKCMLLSHPLLPHVLNKRVGASPRTPCFST